MFLLKVTHIKKGFINICIWIQYLMKDILLCEDLNRQETL